MITIEIIAKITILELILLPLKIAIIINPNCWYQKLSTIHLFTNPNPHKSSECQKT